MFDTLKTQDKASRLILVAGEYKEGVELYKAFKQSLDSQDRIRTPRLAVKLDSWHNGLTVSQKEDYAALLVKEGLIIGVLAEATITFNARFISPIAP